MAVAIPRPSWPAQQSFLSISPTGGICRRVTGLVIRALALLSIFGHADEDGSLPVALHNRALGRRDDALLERREQLNGGTPITITPTTLPSPRHAPLNHPFVDAVLR